MEYDLNYLTTRILAEENLLPGDKIDIERLETISKRYNISTKVLCITILNVSEAAYRGLYSEHSNSKACIIMKEKVPAIVELYKSRLSDIFKIEAISENTIVDYKLLDSLAKKYKINDKLFIVDVLGVSSYDYRKIKNDSTKRVRIFRNYNKESDDLTFALKIIEENNLKIGQKIDYEIFKQILDKYKISELDLCSYLGITKVNLYHMRCDHKKRVVILKEIESTYYEMIKEKIINEDDLGPNDLIDYRTLSLLSDKYNIDLKILATKVLDITDNQYYNLTYKKTSTAEIFKTATMKEADIKKYFELFKSEGIQEGSRVDYSQIETLEKKYSIGPREIMDILGLSNNSFNFIKRERNYKAVVRNPITIKKVMLIKELLPKNDYISCETISKICSLNNITVNDFINYIIKGQRNENYNQDEFYYNKFINGEPIWVGERHPMSNQFINENYEHLLKIFEIVAYRVRKGSGRLSIEEDSASIFEKIYKTSGDLEKNFIGNELFTLIYRRAVTIMKNILYREFNKSVKTIERNKENEDFYDNLYLNEENTEKSYELDNSILDTLISLVNYGYSENEAIAKVLKKKNITFDELKRKIIERK